MYSNLAQDSQSEITAIADVLKSAQEMQQKTSHTIESMFVDLGKIATGMEATVQRFHEVEWNLNAILEKTYPWKDIITGVSSNTKIDDHALQRIETKLDQLLSNIKVETPNIYQAQNQNELAPIISQVSKNIDAIHERIGDGQRQRLIDESANQAQILSMISKMSVDENATQTQIMSMLSQVCKEIGGLHEKMGSVQRQRLDEQSPNQTQVMSMLARIVAEVNAIPEKIEFAPVARWIDESAARHETHITHASTDIRRAVEVSVKSAVEKIDVAPLFKAIQEAADKDTRAILERIEAIGKRGMETVPVLSQIRNDISAAQEKSQAQLCKEIGALHDHIGDLGRRRSQEYSSLTESTSMLSQTVTQVSKEISETITSAVSPNQTQVMSILSEIRSDIHATREKTQAQLCKDIGAIHEKIDDEQRHRSVQKTDQTQIMSVLSEIRNSINATQEKAQALHEEIGAKQRQRSVDENANQTQIMSMLSRVITEIPAKLDESVASSEMHVTQVSEDISKMIACAVKSIHEQTDVAPLFKAIQEAADTDTRAILERVESVEAMFFGAIREKTGYEQRHRSVEKANQTQIMSVLSEIRNDISATQEKNQIQLCKDIDALHDKVAKEERQRSVDENASQAQIMSMLSQVITEITAIPAKIDESAGRNEMHATHVMEEISKSIECAVSPILQKADVAQLFEAIQEAADKDTRAILEQIESIEAVGQDAGVIHEKKKFFGAVHEKIGDEQRHRSIEKASQTQIMSVLSEIRNDISAAQINARALHDKMGDEQRQRSVDESANQTQIMSMLSRVITEIPAKIDESVGRSEIHVTQVSKEISETIVSAVRRTLQKADAALLFEAIQADKGTRAIFEQIESIEAVAEDIYAIHGSRNEMWVTPVSGMTEKVHPVPGVLSEASKEIGDQSMPAAPGHYFFDAPQPQSATDEELAREDAQKEVSWRLDKCKGIKNPNTSRRSSGCPNLLTSRRLLPAAGFARSIDGTPNDEQSTVMYERVRMKKGATTSIETEKELQRQEHVLAEIKKEIEGKERAHRKMQSEHSCYYHAIMVFQLVIAAMIALCGTVLGHIGYSDLSESAGMVGGIVSGCLVSITALCKNQTKMEAHMSAQKALRVSLDRLCCWQTLIREKFFINQVDFLRKVEELKDRIEEVSLTCGYPVNPIKENIDSFPTASQSAWFTACCHWCTAACRCFKPKQSPVELFSAVHP